MIWIVGGGLAVLVLIFAATYSQRHKRDPVGDGGSTFYSGSKKDGNGSDSGDGGGGDGGGDGD